MKHLLSKLVSYRIKNTGHKIISVLQTGRNKLVCWVSGKKHNKTMQVLFASPYRHNRQFIQYAQMIMAFHKDSGFQDIKITFEHTDLKAKIDKAIEILKSDDGFSGPTCMRKALEVLDDSE